MNGIYFFLKIGGLHADKHFSENNIVLTAKTELVTFTSAVCKSLIIVSGNAQPKCFVAEKISLFITQFVMHHIVFLENTWKT